MYATLRRFAFAFVLLFPASMVIGQVATGIYTSGTFDSQGFDTINVGNLNVHLSMPILNKAGRGMPFSYNLSYDSSVWTPVGVGGASYWVPVTDWGWQGISNAAMGYVTGNVNQTSCTWLGPYGPPGPVGHTNVYSGMVYHDSFGVAHSFGGSISVLSSDTCQGYPNTSGSIGPYASDGSGYQFNSQNIVSGTTIITNRTGTTTTLPINESSSSFGTTVITDNNGNEISFDGSGNFTDTTGKIALTVAGEDNSGMTFKYTDTHGNPQTVTLTTASYTVQTAFGCSGVSEYGPVPQMLVSSVSFPDNITYNFSYEATPGHPGNVTGRLAGVQLPQGNWINYTYTGSNNGIVCTDGSAAGLTRGIASDSGSAASTVSYARTDPNGTGTSHTEVVDGYGNYKEYDFDLVSGAPAVPAAAYYEVARNIYNGSNQGTLVDSQMRCWGGVTFPCPAATTSVDSTLTYSTYETLDGLETHVGSIGFNGNGTVGLATASDFLPAPNPGALLRKETWSYVQNISATELSTDLVLDGNNNQIGITDYSYDTTTLTSSSGVPQHVAATGARGNLTKVVQYANPSTYYTSSTNYEDTGSVLTSTSPAGGITKVSYDPTFTYATGTTLPTPSSGVSLSSSATYDTSYTGLPLTTTDPNGQVSKISSYDVLLRPLTVNSPDGGVTTFTYSPTLVTQQTAQSSGVNAETETQLDGYGRPSRVAVANGQSGNSWYQSDTCYDANGNVAFASYPYQGPGFSAGKVCSGAGDTYSYDVLGRLTSVVRANGETRTYTYLGRATKSVDENGVTRISQVDGLGRPTIICEISSNSSMPGSGSPVSCGTDIAGTGFVTSYAYSLVNGTTTISQGGQARVFKSDWLGRPISVQEPERGTTTYSYSYNATGMVVTRTRPKANQTSASVTTTTTTQYDLLGRVVSISYSDGTPTKTFAYDKSAGANFTDLTQANFKGRLSLASVSNAMTAFSYDPVGRTSYLDECLPSGCGTPANNHQLHYTYDLAGDILTSTDGAGVTTTYNLTPASELASMTSSISSYMNSSASPTTIIASTQNGPNGPSVYQLGNTLTGVNGFDTLGRVSGGWVCANSSSASCSGGTQIYGFTAGWKGQQLQSSSDSVLAQTSSYGYDEFNRLTSRTVTAGTGVNYSWGYDRWGNRTSQTMTGGTGSGNSFSASYNTATNQINTAGYTYDAAGNVTNDGFHTYTYDAEGNVTAMSGGTAASYVYNALNQRVRTTVGSAATEYVFNSGGQRVSEWNPATQTPNKGKYYWGGTPVAYYTTGAAGGTHFEHQDWLGTERLRTSYNGGVEASFTSLPWGDGQSAAGMDTDANHYAMLDHDTESDTDHAQFRQYSNLQGRFMSPDPYDGSYNLGNPQSMNRYVYAMNNPLSNVDPSGKDCVEVNENGTVVAILNGDCPTDGVPVDAGGYGGGSYGIFIDANGVTDATINDNGDLSGYTIAGMYYSATEDSSGSVVPGGGSGGGSSNDMEYDIFHCPSCVNTWKQSDCVVSQPWINAATAVVVGVPAAAIQSGTNNVNGSFLEGAWTAIKEGTASAGAAAAYYATGIFLTAKYMVKGCPQ
jgi:RHS repeat-associated protein